MFRIFLHTSALGSIQTTKLHEKLRIPKRVSKNGLPGYCRYGHSWQRFALTSRVDYYNGGHFLSLLNYATAKNSLTLVNIFGKQWTEDKLVWIMSLRENV
jgi:hypothetical protein